jgi:cell division protein FtsB
LTDALTLLGPKGCDGISIHAYTHGADPKQIYTDALMNPPFQNRQYNFRCYQDFMAAIPTGMRSLPVYLTEADQNDEWRDENNGWVQRVYGEIDWWNRQPGNQKIRALILYRWPKGLDKWGIEGKAGVIEDFRQAMRFNYRWEAAAAEPIQPVQPPQPTVPVQPPQPVVDTSPISFPQTGHATSGSFAAFHRQYGLDITGYPISEIYVSPESGLKTQDWQRLIMEEFPAGAIRLRLAGTQLAELRARIGQLEQEIGRLKAGAGGPAEPPISDISSQLPRKPEGLVKRPVSEIKYIVINHTGVRPDVGADRVAQAQLARFPGIVGQYFITGAGQIQQTHPDDEVVARDQGWIYNGLNVYVAGNFDAAVPGADQLDALAQLCAWLLAKYNLPEDALKGVSEFITTHSPGLQWLNGQRWKDTLLQRVRAIPAQPAGPTPQPTEDVTALRAQLAELQARAQQLQAQVDDLQARNAELQVQLEAARKGTGGAKVAPPAITDITVQLPRNADSLKSRPAGQIRFLVFNHTAVDPSVGVERIAAAHQKRWGAILYQYCITADGTILQTNALDQVVDLSQPWIAEGVNVALAGNFTAEIPNDKQLAAAAQLSAWLMQTYQIPVENVKGVSEFVNSQSPGKQWLEGRKYKDLLLARVDELLRAAGPAPKPADAAIIATLRTEIGRLQTALGQAQTQVAALTQERDQLKAQVGKPSSASRCRR